MADQTLLTIIEQHVAFAGLIEHALAAMELGAFATAAAYFEMAARTTSVAQFESVALHAAWCCRELADGHVSQPD